MKNTLVGILLLLVLGLSLFLYVERQSIHLSAPRLKDGSLITLPDAQLKEFPSGKHQPLSSFRGKVILLNFWASWCDACREEMASLAQLNDTLKGDGFSLVSINLDDRPEQIIPRSIRELNLNFPVYTDERNMLVEYFRVVALPFSVAINRAFNVVWSESGAKDWASGTILQEFRKLIGSR